jgi:hypothetical protein
VRRRRKRRPVTDGAQQLDRRPGADTGHRGEDLGEWVGGQQFVELAAQGLTLRQPGRQLVGQAADDAAVLGGGWDRHALVSQRPDDP